MIVGRDSSVGNPTRYGVDGPEIESFYGRISPARSNRPWYKPGHSLEGEAVRGVVLTTQTHPAPRLKKE